MLYADVVLPLSIYSTFTYSVPDDMAGSLSVGSRVLVQFGRSKLYTGIVAGIRRDFKGEFDVKPIMSMLDTYPILRNPQMRLWQWIADYYLCSPGDVYRAAVPASLKPESETWLSINPDYEPDEEQPFSEVEKAIVTLTEQKKRIRLADLEKSIKGSRVTQAANRLLERGVLEVTESLSERYRAKTIQLVRIPADIDRSVNIQTLFDKVKGAPRQEKLLLAYIGLSGWTRTGAPLQQVEKKNLLCKAEVSQAIFKALVDKGLMEEYRQSVNRFTTTADNTQTTLSPLTPVQEKAYRQILDSYSDHQVTLLHGVTGSGKTEIYTHLIDRVLKDGSQVLFLVPEISLTTQLTDRLRAVFGQRLLVYHSRFSDNERADIWKKILSGNEPLVVLGARSSIFLPFAHIGLVIVDEEHEASFKQHDPAPRYNARDAAIVLATMHGAKVLLGSATPSVETYYKASGGKYGLVTLDSRYGNASLPAVTVTDMKEERARKLSKGIISSTLRSLTLKALSAGRQAILFQNRRGFAPVVICHTCGWTPRCPNCDVSLVFHKHSNLIRCHYCGHTMPLPALCPACGENTLEAFGYGTERIAEEMEPTFPSARIARMDLDTTRNKDSYQKIIEGFSNHQTDILIGTQMVTKGLDFGGVGVVGVLNADLLLNFPDFRSNERAFNTLEQVAGRAGRRDGEGTVVVQTTAPHHRILRHVCNHDYASYYEEEIADRKELNYPPFSRIVTVYVKNKNKDTAATAANLLAQALRDVFGARVLGPQQPFVSRVATYYLQQLMLKIEADASMPKVKAILRSIYESLARDTRIKSSNVYYDVDPV